MEEKKLTDEEIVKALECCSKSFDCNNCKCDKENNNRFICSENLLKDCLDLIHRLQDDYSNLKERYVKVLGLNEKVIAEQKAEIERLTAEINQRREMMSRMDCNYATELQKNTELQKQVKSLTEENKELHNDNTTLIAGFILQKEQVEKDTAKEILQGFDKWLKQAISDSYDKSVSGSIRHGGRNTAFHEVKELVKKVAKEKGVEVE